MRFFKAHQKLQQTVVGFFGSLSLHAIRHPARVLVITALITLAAAPGMLRLTLRTDGQALVSPTAPEVLADKAVRDHFGIHDQLVVLIRSPARRWHFQSGHAATGPRFDGGVQTASRRCSV